MIALAVVAVAVLLGAAGMWRRSAPESFARLVVDRVRGRWRWFGYWRLWRAGCVNMGLTGKRVVRKNGKATTVTLFPKIRRVRSSAHVDRLRVKMLPGQTLADWAEQADKFATLYDAQECRVRTPLDGQAHRRFIDLTLLRTDVLRTPVRSHPLPAAPDFTALPVAVTEDGRPYRLRLLGTHVLGAGATGAGKGSFLWSTVEQLAPAIASGLVRLVGIDPKALELSMASGLFNRLVDGDPAQVADCLDDLVATMNARKARMRGLSRLHEPTAAEPFYVVVIDEAAALTQYASDRDARKRIDAALGLLLSQGRALGISVILAVQDPRKETIGFRSLVPTRVALRLTEPNEPDMVLGEGARSRGALADQIAPTAPGVAYVLVDGQPEPVRIRFPFVSDERLAELATAYPAPIHHSGADDLDAAALAVPALKEAHR